MMHNQNHLNSLVGRMFANATNKQQQAVAAAAVSQATTRNTTESTSTTTFTTNNASAAAPATNIKRNLFGISLNHDQLKQDLHEMWQEQLDRKKRQWNFDFETLKPIESMEASEPLAQRSRFEWNKVKTAGCSVTHQSNDFVLTSFDSNESYVCDATSDEDEEYDEALAMPAFYKYQRRQKMNNGFKFIQIESQTQSKRQTTVGLSSAQTALKQTAFSKLKQTNNNSNCGSSSSQHKSTATTLHRPRPVRSSAVNSSSKQQSSQPRQQNLIITLSENRKDTLRSAISSSSSSSSKTSRNNELKALKRDAKSAFKKPVSSQTVESTPMKQQSLLDMLKQRKRKTPGDCSSKTSTKQVVLNEALQTQVIGTANSIVHNLRPRTISFN